MIARDAFVDAMLERAPTTITRVAAERYARDLEGRGAALDAFPPDVAALIAACLDGSEAAMRTFEERYFPRLDEALRSVGDGAFVEEVKQHLRMRLYPPPGGSSTFETYLGRGSLEGWLRVSAMRLAIDLRRKRGEIAADPDPERASVAIARQEPELEHLRARHLRDFERAFDAALETLDPAERSLLRYYYVDRLTLEELAALLRSSKSTIARRLTQIRERLVASTRTHLRASLSLSTESVVDVSLASALDRADQNP